MDAESVITTLKDHANPERALGAARYFKTGPGEYGEGDIFLGITVPDLRKLTRAYYSLNLTETEILLHSPYHEARLTALYIWDYQFMHGTAETQEAIFTHYLANTAYINNWDLVDTSAGTIVGLYLAKRDKTILSKLAKSPSIWERRIAIISCFPYIRSGDASFAFTIIQQLQHDPHDLIQKAVGWMLREIGKCCSKNELFAWLKQDSRYQTIPRTMLRYAIEHFDPEERRYYMQK